MASHLNRKRLGRGLEWALAFVGAMNCTVVPIMFAASQSQLFPMPALYFIEIALLGILAIIAVAVQAHDANRWAPMPWISAGALAPFVILAGFSFGFFLLPAVVAFLLTGILMDRRLGSSRSWHAGLMLVAAVIQAALILLGVVLR